MGYSSDPNRNHQQGLSPSQEDIDRAVTVLQAVQAAKQQLRGAIAVEGRIWLIRPPYAWRSDFTTRLVISARLKRVGEQTPPIDLAKLGGHIPQCGLLDVRTSL